MFFYLGMVIVMGDVGVRDARISLGRQLKEVPYLLRGISVGRSILGCRLDFSWDDARFGVIISTGRDAGDVGSDEWMIYRVSLNLARNGDAAQMIALLLKSRRALGLKVDKGGE